MAHPRRSSRYVFEVVRGVVGPVAARQHTRGNVRASRAKANLPAMSIEVLHVKRHVLLVFTLA